MLADDNAANAPVGYERLPSTAGGDLLHPSDQTSVPRSLGVRAGHRRLSQGAHTEAIVCAGAFS
jgi:hypothetical protein